MAEQRSKAERIMAMQQCYRFRLGALCALRGREQTWPVATCKRRGER